MDPSLRKEVGGQAFTQGSPAGLPYHRQEAA